MINMKGSAALDIAIIVIIALVGILVASNLQAIKTFFSPVEKQSSTSQQIVMTQNAYSVPRWNHFPITVYIENYDAAYTNDVITAINTWESSTNNLIQFSVVSSTNADITIHWVRSISPDSSATGETELTYLNTSLYSIIQSADIKLLEQYRGGNFRDNDETNVALHELGHALGLEHSTVPGDVMYHAVDIPSRNIIQPSQAYTELFNEIYQTSPKTDLTFYGQINASKSSITQMSFKSYYANVVFAVRNIGLVDSNSTTVSIYADNNLINDQSLPSLQPSENYVVSITNMRSPTDFSQIRLVIDKNSLLDELNKTNNVAVVNLSQQP
jgi:predicted Zn-dependent protease